MKNILCRLLTFSFLILYKCQAVDIKYNIIDLGTLGGNTSDAWAINDNGQIVGTAQRLDGSWHAYFFLNDSIMK